MSTLCALVLDNPYLPILVQTQWPDFHLAGDPYYPNHTILKRLIVFIVISFAAMPPRRSTRRINNVTHTPPPPPLQYDPVMVQAAITAAVAAALTQINTNGAGGTGSSTNHLNHGTGHGYIRECTYKEFSNAKPKTFNGVGGVIALMQWFEKTETVFEICACLETSKVKFAACTFSDRSLTWWKGHVDALSLPVPNAMSWEDLKILMLEEYCPRGEIQKLEHEIWNLRMTGSDVITYTARFNDFSALCPSMVNVTPPNLNGGNVRGRMTSCGSVANEYIVKKAMQPSYI
ncbi:hypothetical protein Lser_V15G40585 [Lactuca serriola]